MIHIPAFDLPDSNLLSANSRQVLTNHREQLAEMMAAGDQSAPDNGDADPVAQVWQQFYQSPAYKSLLQRYAFTVEQQTIGGVPTHVFLPAQGLATYNQQRVLINLHSGGFEDGSQTGSFIESIPVAALGQIKVISVDYRLAPEYQFPAATDDVVAVYTDLLNDYSPEHIGIYGASSGAHLCAQTLVRLQEQGLPQPAAIGLIAEGAVTMTGDSVAFIGAMLKAQYGMDLAESLQQIRYLEQADLNSPQVTPGQSDAVMAQFPPTLLLSSSRDFMLSTVLATHSQLVRLGVEAQLHVWEGLDHTFHYNPDLPETEELHRVTLNFFEKHLQL